MSKSLPKAVKSSPQYGGIHMPRPRFQEGHVRLEGKKIKKWIGMYRVSEIGPDEKEHRRQRKLVLGPKAKMTKTKAREKLRGLIERETGQTPQASEDVTLGWFARERYLPMREAVLKPSSAKHLRWFIEKQLIPRWGTWPLATMDRFAMQTWLNELAEQEASHSIIHKARTYLSAILGEAVEAGFLVKNAAERLETPRVAPIERRVLSQEECARLSAALEGRDRLIFLLLVESGLRPGELFALRWNDVEPGVLRVDERIYAGQLDEPKTVASIGYVSIPQRIEELLRAWGPGTRNGREFIFPSARLSSPLAPANWLRRSFQPVAERLKLTGINFQVLRRTFATLIQKCGTIKDAQSLLRHRSPVMTLGTYMQAIPESQRAAVEGLDKLIVESRVQ